MSHLFIVVMIIFVQFSFNNCSMSLFGGSSGLSKKDQLIKDQLQIQLPQLGQSSTSGSVYPIGFDVRYVRQNGGDSLVCNGKSNTDFSSGVVDQNCAWNSLDVMNQIDLQQEEIHVLFVDSGEYHLNRTLQIRSSLAVLGNCQSKPLIYGREEMGTIFYLDTKGTVSLSCVSLASEENDYLSGIYVETAYQILVDQVNYYNARGYFLNSFADQNIIKNSHLIGSDAVLVMIHGLFEIINNKIQGDHFLFKAFSFKSEFQNKIVGNEFYSDLLQQSLDLSNDLNLKIENNQFINPYSKF